MSHNLCQSQFNSSCDCNKQSIDCVITAFASPFLHYKIDDLPYAVLLTEKTTTATTTWIKLSWNVKS